jgi:PLP dependent protein
MPYERPENKAVGNTEETRERVAEVLGRIAEAADRSGRRAEDIRLIAVSKSRSVAQIEAVHAAGMRDFGENYAQEALEKAEELAASGITWHFIGHLQRNKARSMVGLVDWLHTLDSEKLAREVDRHAMALERRLPCLVEVNVSGEESKSGVRPEELHALCETARALPWVALRGLMTIAPWPPEETTARRAFAGLRKLAEGLRSEGFPTEELSMGMSADYEVAVEEGATMVRLGTAIFGSPRRN